MNSDKKLQIGERLASIRAAKRLSQKEMGAKLGISWRTYQNYEVGTREISVEFVMAFCNAFAIRPEWLVDGTGGTRRVDEAAAFKSTLLSVDELARKTGPALHLTALADVAARLFRKRIDGHELTDQDLQDYIDLKRNG